MSRTTLGYFWQRPRTHRERVPDRVVSSLELFYDLVYVALIARVAQGLHGEITLGALATFCVLFGLLWVGWYNGSVLHDAHGRPDVRTRLLTFLQMFALASIAVYAPDAAGAGGVGFAASSLVVLVVLVGQWVVVARMERGDPLYGPVATRYTVTMAVMTAWIGLSIVASGPARLWMWAAFTFAYVVGMALQVVRSPRAASAQGAMSTTTEGVPQRTTQGAPEPAVDTEQGSPLATESLLERFGLFVIIVLGEVVAGVVAGLGSVEALTPTAFATGFAGLAVAMAFWWTYFDLIGRREPAPTLGARYLFNLVQLPLALAITGVGGVTVSLIERSHSDDLAGPSWSFAAFVALALLSAGAAARLLRDWSALAPMYRPATRAGLGVIALAAVLAAVGASPVVLTTSVFLGMAAQWAFAVRGWLRTDEGARFVAHAASIDRAEASWEI